MKLFYSLLFGGLLIMSCRTAEQQKKAYMRHTFHAIKKALDNAEVSSLSDSVRVIFPSNIMFGFDSAIIKAELQPSLHRFAKAINKFDKTAVLISGYTDNIGDDSYNERLSAQRADTAKSALIRNAVDPVRISTWGMGKRHPVADNATEEGRAKNRRVEFIILYEAKK
ncbi:OmpA family protein [Rurimicrobium arvi]|uniref:OmpA-like domain-containing protein n=1 Tax=Rurimicrobium arvi TaxID=2049916 RepID=A0ABP8MK22_9BACT